MTARSYKKEIHRFFQFLKSEGVALPNDVSELDFQVAEFINALYHEGARWPLSGLKRFLPRLKFRLPTAQQYYNSWLQRLWRGLPGALGTTMSLFLF